MVEYHLLSARVRSEFASEIYMYRNYITSELLYDRTRAHYCDGNIDRQLINRTHFVVHDPRKEKKKKQTCPLPLSPRVIFVYLSLRIYRGGIQIRAVCRVLSLAHSG